MLGHYVSKDYNNYQEHLSGVILKNICSEYFLQIIIKVFVAEFILSKIPRFTHILLNTFRRVRLYYQNFS